MRKILKIFILIQFFILIKSCNKLSNNIDNVLPHLYKISNNLQNYSENINLKQIENTKSINPEIKEEINFLKKEYNLTSIKKYKELNGIEFKFSDRNYNYYFLNSKNNTEFSDYEQFAESKIESKRINSEWYFIKQSK